MDTAYVMTSTVTTEHKVITGAAWFQLGSSFFTKFISAVKQMIKSVIHKILPSDIKLNDISRSSTKFPRETQDTKDIGSKPANTITATTTSNNHGEESLCFDEIHQATHNSLPCLPLATRSTNYRQASARPPYRKLFKSRFPSNTISAASTEMPVDTLCISGSNQSLESGKTVHRKSTEVIRVLSNAITSESSMCLPLQSSPFHRRCQSTRVLSTTEYFAKLLRTAIYRKEANTVRNLLSSSVKHTDEDIGAIICNSINEEGYTLIHSAVLSQSHVILNSLLEALPSESIRKEAVESCGGLGNKYSPLHLAALKDNVEAASILLEHGANANSKSKLGTSPLHLAINTCNSRMVELLLSHGSDPNAISLVGNTPLISAVRKKSITLVESLLGAGANPRASVKNGMSAKALALEMNAIDILEKMDGSVKLRGHMRTASETQKLNYQ